MLENTYWDIHVTLAKIFVVHEQRKLFFSLKLKTRVGETIRKEVLNSLDFNQPDLIAVREVETYRK